jgi:hypothetical protein
MATDPATQTTAQYGQITVPFGGRASANQAAAGTTASTSTSPFGFATSTQANALITLVDQIRTDLIAVGIIKGAA